MNTVSMSADAAKAAASTPQTKTITVDVTPPALAACRFTVYFADENATSSPDGGKTLISRTGEPYIDVFGPDGKRLGGAYASDTVPDDVAAILARALLAVTT